MVVSNAVTGGPHLDVTVIDRLNLTHVRAEMPLTGGGSRSAVFLSVRSDAIPIVDVCATGLAMARICTAHYC